MKIRTLALNMMNSNDLINNKTISHNKNIYRTQYSLPISRNINKKDKESKTNNTRIKIQNFALLKSLSINTNNDYKILIKDRYNLTQVPRLNIFKSNYFKKRAKSGLKFINYINDEKFFCTSKTIKRFLFPKDNYIIKKSRINHDINYFNIRNVITDYTKQYEKNSYKIKKVIKNDIFVNKIKNDLLKMKFGNQIKLFDNL